VKYKLYAQKTIMQIHYGSPYERNRQGKSSLIQNKTEKFMILFCISDKILEKQVTYFE